MALRGERLKKKHPEVRHEISRHAVIWVVEYDSHEASISSSLSCIDAWRAPDYSQDLPAFVCMANDLGQNYVWIVTCVRRGGNLSWVGDECP